MSGVPKEENDKRKNSSNSKANDNQKPASDNKAPRGKLSRLGSQVQVRNSKSAIKKSINNQGQAVPGKKKKSSAKGNPRVKIIHDEKWMARNTVPLISEAARPSKNVARRRHPHRGLGPPAEEAPSSPGQALESPSEAAQRRGTATSENARRDQEEAQGATTLEIELNNRLVGEVKKKEQLSSAAASKFRDSDLRTDEEDLFEESDESTISYPEAEGLIIQVPDDYEPIKPFQRKRRKCLCRIL